MDCNILVLLLVLLRVLLVQISIFWELGAIRKMKFLTQISQLSIGSGGKFIRL